MTDQPELTPEQQAQIEQARIKAERKKVAKRLREMQRVLNKKAVQRTKHRALR